jgi:hypothetical protein
MGLQQLVTGIEEGQPAAVLYPALPKLLTLFPADDAVISSVNQTDRELPAADDRGDPSGIGSEFAHGRPAGIQVIPDRSVIDIVDREFVDAWIDEAQRVAQPQQEEEPARPAHRPAKEQVAHDGTGGHPIPDAHFQSVRSEQDKLVDRSGMVFSNLQSDPAAHAVTDEAPGWRSRAGSGTGDNFLHDLIKLRRRKQ